MSESDILSVQLWFGAAAIAFLAIAMTAAGWNQKYFVGGMFVLAALMAVLALFWRQIRLWIPDKSGDLILALANSPVSWFVMFVIGTTIIFAIGRIRRGGQEAAIPPGWLRSYRPIQVYQKHFRNEPVILDGHAYQECRFDNVTFIYNGTTSLHFTHNSIVGSQVFKTNNIVVSTTVFLLRGMGLLSERLRLQTPPWVHLSPPRAIDGEPPEVPRT